MQLMEKYEDLRPALARVFGQRHRPGACVECAGQIVLTVASQRDNALLSAPADQGQPDQRSKINVGLFRGEWLSNSSRHSTTTSLGDHCVVASIRPRRAFRTASALRAPAVPLRQPGSHFPTVPKPVNRCRSLWFPQRSGLSRMNLPDLQCRSALLAIRYFRQWCPMFWAVIKVLTITGCLQSS